jgi:hypothetical protein
MGQGIADLMTEGSTTPEQEQWLSQIFEFAFNMMIYLFSTGLIILGAYQLVLICYLYLLGPVAAAFYAWPSLTQNNKLFRTIFGNWLNAVITVALWRFYWLVILAIMTQRILYLGQSGAGQLDLQWEVAVFTCLLGLMLYAPFHPWEFDPAQAFATASQYGNQLMNGSSGQGGQGGSTLGQTLAGNSPQLQQAVSNVTNAMNQFAAASPMAAQEQMLGPSAGTNLGNPFANQQQSSNRSNSALQTPEPQPFSGNSSNPPNVQLPPPAGGNQQVQSPQANNDLAPPSATTGGAGQLPAANQDALKLVSSILGNQAMSMSQPTPELSPPPGASVSSPLAMVNPNAPMNDVFNASADMAAPGSSGPPPVFSPSPPSMPEPLMTV